MPPPGSRPNKESGFTVLEMLIAASVLAVALLGHTASIFSEQRLSTAQQMRSSALLASEQFMERLRSDDDWTGLYARLRTVKLQSMLSGIGGVALDDGRRALRPQTYYPDFYVSLGLREFHVLVDVPTLPDASGVSALPLLREDATLDAFGLPSDLNGDGVIDDDSRVDDYRALPVVVTFRWETPGVAPEELRVSSCLWGYR